LTGAPGTGGQGILVFTYIATSVTTNTTNFFMMF
jgi:hypothetical protein